ncbi:DUF3987 domain-containing protein [Halomonas sp. 5021]|uniref:DUF3987 domain-containing protein n=1 Tax=Halomonas sp. 5021 TaxID=3082156 RepID=UPI002FCC7506
MENDKLSSGCSYTRDSGLRNHEWPILDENSVFEGAVVEISRSLEISYEMALLTALSAMSSACQGIANVELPTGYRVPLSLYILIIALSGERKTAVENAFFLEIKKIERELLDKHQKDIEDYKRRIHNWSLHERELGKLLARAASKCEETKEGLNNCRLSPIAV